MKHTVEYAVPYMYIYMELERKTGTGSRGKFEVPKSTTIWHLEDERRPLNALCGFVLKGKAKAVSPALAIFGKPCKDCKAIARAYVSPPSESRGRPGMLLETYQVSRMKMMMGRGGDVQFREQVHLRVERALFIVNGKDQKFANS